MKTYKPFGLILLFTLPLPLIAQVNWKSPESIDTKKLSVSTASGQAVVVTANPLASDAALRALEEGGTAMDAVISAQTVLTVVEPQSSGLGGGSFLLYWDQAKKTLYALDGRETASAQAEEDMWMTSDGGVVPWLQATRSPSAIGVPGTTALLWEGHREFGRLPWKTNFRRSIQLAKEGFIPSPRFLRSISLAKTLGINHSRTFKSLYLPNGSLPKQNIPFHNKKLAATLIRLAKGGINEFYRGKVANELITELQLQQKNNKEIRTITHEDLENYKVQKRNPICRKYKSWKICSFPPPSGGGVAVLQALGTYEFLSKANWSDNTITRWHLLAESLRFADADRSHWIGDPIDWPVPLKGLLEEDYIRERANAIKISTTTFRPLPGKPKGSELLDLASQPRTAGGGTTHLVVVDLDGNVASYTSSVETVFGSRHLSGGMVLNNQLTDFSFLSNVSGKPIANRIKPNKRPMSSMSPVIVFRDERPILAVGSPGGWLIPHYVTNALIGALDLKLSPKEVVSQNLLSVQPAYTVLEQSNNWSKSQANIQKGLRSLGHQIKYSSFSSGIALIKWHKGSWHGAADPRREGKAVSLQVEKKH
ncbi:MULTISPECIES: gamma-glutamyltransferase family protein [Prochlorococcus]|uniref:Gamma-glutamyltransferase n=1 Tax=Prochlorococcus marinus (strain SARG / CCMP1375 / SS120) TaxID=167539 RepID=Q7VAE2_PROMA|nr:MULTISPECIES: gamma-glutamyltransferase family protein [Prochlorococcus]AAQ00566.1 Gamma-glutamyltransferase [Prochlorococcus marinus subsp. marinus str. CCMP1375]KGG10949.1 Gamma-glutamyltranspeptidase [Prochlorococcus marinus str. LG]KGG19960.1 Gamma-glutamyltranspeptidase [Prochlorococcus marinus str. SS2]KGG24198.1 Gamma-glutamyltranspeptidase [Prochlorococcus marinus str. SS35]KGG31545.1 Gamma-glutamyltranspeptidase [Prochlorococcus marinus str. SS51]